MKFIKYKQVARITFYGFDDLYRDNNSSVFTEPLNSVYYTQNINAGVPVGNNAKRMRFQIKGLDNVNGDKSPPDISATEIVILLEGEVIVVKYISIL